MELQYFWNLDTDPDWTTEGQWTWGQPTGGGGAHGNPDPTSGHTGNYVYGYNLSGDYTDSMPEMHLTSKVIACSTIENVTLKFWRWLGVEGVFDKATIYVSNNGTDWTQIWQNTVQITDSSWTQMSYDISAVADGQPTVYLRWSMGPTDVSWVYCGWNIDDIELWGDKLIFFTFTNPIPVHLSTTYGTTEQLQITATISGVYESYTYDASFYDELGVQVGTTVLGVNSGSSATSNAYLPTPSGVDYNWYVVATSSGGEDNSETYTFSNRFLYEGYVTENSDPVSRTVRLYYRDTGELIDSTTSSGSNGYYSFDALVNDEHFIVAFDDEAGEDYNSLILDRLLPNGE